MSDFNSSLPIRTQSNGDAIVEICDGTVTTQKLAITAAGEAKVDVTSSAAFGSPSGGTAGTQSDLVGGIYNSTPPTLTNGQQASLQLASDGDLLVDSNITKIGGSAPSASNSLPVEVTLGTSFVSPTNPFPVQIGDIPPGTPVNDFKDATSIGAGSSDNHQYTAGGSNGFRLEQIYASGSGKFKCVIGIETGVGTGTFTTIFVSFNSTATPYVPNLPLVATGVRVQVTMTNNDLSAQDLYSTISGYTY
jgi:hypothetical protein